jgi:hypothetical protein
MLPSLLPAAAPGCRNIKTLVLDEADEMLNKGFKEQIYDIYRYLPPETQVGGCCVRSVFCCWWCEGLGEGSRSTASTATCPPRHRWAGAVLGV